MVPGPGAYSPNVDALARVATAPAYTLGGNLRTDFTASATTHVPGPGAYTLGASDIESSKNKAPSYSLGVTGSQGRSGFVPRTTGPGPNSYSRPDTAVDVSPRRGFSFGVKERTRHDKSTISVRCHGPLASLEAMGWESPGPGAYDTRSVRMGGRSSEGVPSLKFDRADRNIGPRIYFSKCVAQHDMSIGCFSAKGPDGTRPGRDC